MIVIIKINTNIVFVSHFKSLSQSFLRFLFALLSSSLKNSDASSGILMLFCREPCSG